MARRIKRRGRSFGGKVSLMGTIVGVGGYIAYEAFLSPRIPLVGTAKNLAELALGVWLSRKGGVVGNIAKAAIVLNAYQLLSGLMSGMTGIGLATAPAVKIYS